MFLLKAPKDSFTGKTPKDFIIRTYAETVKVVDGIARCHKQSTRDCLKVRYMFRDYKPEDELVTANVGVPMKVGSPRSKTGQIKLGHKSLMDKFGVGEVASNIDEALKKGEREEKSRHNNGKGKRRRGRPKGSKSKK